MQRWIGTSMLLWSLGCAHRPRPSAHLFADPVTVMGHRGARGLAPENTVAALRVAQELGVPIELDTMLCGSGELVVFHDETLDRTTDGRGLVSETPLATIAALDAGAHFSDATAGEPVPLLSSVLSEFGDLVRINIEVKGARGASAPALAAAVVSAVESAGLTEQVIVTSFNPFILEAVRAENPNIFRGQIYGTFRGADLSGLEKFLLRNLAFNRRAAPDLLMMEDAHATRGRLRRLHRRGYRVFVWTVNDEAAVQHMLSVGVDGIITDYPDRVLGWLRSQSGNQGL